MIESVGRVKPENVENVPNEVFIDFREKPPKLFIDLKVLVKVVEERKKLRSKDRVLSNTKRYNILNLFIDTVSRRHFFRKFKETAAFLEEHYSKEETLSKKSLENGFEAFQMMRMHSIRGYTYPNVMAHTYGNYMDSYDIKMTRIDTKMKKKGYITGIASNHCNAIELERKWNSDPMAYVDKSPPDHEFY